MNASTKARHDYYINEAARIDSKTKTIAQLRKALLTMEYSAVELVTDEQVIACAKDSRTALLHRARAVKSAAKRQQIAA